MNSANREHIIGLSRKGFAGEQVVLRLPNFNDRHDLAEAIRSAATHCGHYLSWATTTYSEGEAEYWIAAANQAAEQNTELPLNIFRKSDGKLIGAMGLHSISKDGCRACIGYWLRHDVTKNGFAKDALIALAKFAFGEMKMLRLEIATSPLNESSIKLAKSVGASFEGVARNRIRRNDIPSDAAIFSLTPKDFGMEN